MAKKRINYTDTDVVGKAPASPDAQVRVTEIKNIIEAIGTVAITDPAVVALVDSFKAKANYVGSTTLAVDVDGPDAGVSQETNADEGANTGASGDIEGSEEKLNERLAACLEQLKRDFERGIVIINENASVEDYKGALENDKTAGQKWEGEDGLEEHLRTYLLGKVNGVTRLELAEKMPGGPCLIGIHADGTPAIRQRSREIVNVVITKEGKAVLLAHEEAVQRVASTREKYGKAVEIVKCVQAAGYRVPPDLPNGRKKGLVAASEAVMGGSYVESPVTRGPQVETRRNAMLECPENTSDRSDVSVVYFFASRQQTYVYSDCADRRADFLGAILWL